MSLETTAELANQCNYILNNRLEDFLEALFEYAKQEMPDDLKRSIEESRNKKLNCLPDKLI